MLLLINIRWLSWYSMFLNERFTHKCSLIKVSVKVYGPTRSESTSHLLVWVYRERCVNIWYLRVLYTVFVLVFHHKKFSSSTITPCHVLIGVKLNHRTSNCGWTKIKMKPKFQPGRFLWVGPVKTRVLVFALEQEVLQ